jgi:hypothetical protein
MVGYTKLLVGLGFSKNPNKDDIEVIDLKNPSMTCKNLPTFPKNLYNSFGGLGHQDKPIVCGGHDGLYAFFNRCYSLEGKKWRMSSSTLNTPRAWASVSPSPFPSKSHSLFVTGGFSGSSDLKTAEALTERGWEMMSLPPLPVTIEDHCSVVVNATTLLVIGGLQDGFRSSNTFYFNSETEVWTKGPQMKEKRINHSCGRIRKNSQILEYSIIVAGGVFYFL